MDFTNALLVVAAVYALTEWAKSAAPSIRNSSALTILTAAVAGQAAVWGLATTVWANEQVIGGHTLDKLNGGSKVAAGFFVALLATGTDKLIGMVKNVGQNQPTRQDQTTTAPK